MLFDTYKYIVDTCSFTKLIREYPPDVFPGVWDKINELAEQQKICSVKIVFWEIEEKDDEIADWAEKNRHIFLPMDQDIQEKVKQILRTHSNLLDIRKDKSGADPFLIAAAMIYKCIVVTEEKPSGGPERSKIPDVCKHYNIKCIRVLDMLRLEGLKL